jgi:hypothetical protein
MRHDRVVHAFAISVPDLGVTPYALSHPEYQVHLALGWARVYPGKVKCTDFLLARTIEKIVPLYDGTRATVGRVP